MKNNYPIIICGSRPTGLMLAAQLLLFNIDFLIIDKKDVSNYRIESCCCAGKKHGNL